jgi:hypothetical protein
VDDDAGVARKLAEANDTGRREPAREIRVGVVCFNHLSGREPLADLVTPHLEEGREELGKTIRECAAIHLLQGGFEFRCLIADVSGRLRITDSISIH